MDKLIKKLNEEMNSWVNDLVANSDLPTEELFKSYSYEYCIRKEIVYYFEENAIGDWFENFLLSKEDILSYLYIEYIEDDLADIHNEIESFINNIIYKLQLKDR